MTYVYAAILSVASVVASLFAGLYIVAACLGEPPHSSTGRFIVAGIMGLGAFGLAVFAGYLIS